MEHRRWRAHSTCRRLSKAGLAAAIVCLAGVAQAEDQPAAAQKKVAIPAADTLIGKTLDPDLAYAISQQAKPKISGDWSYGFSGDAEGGLTRAAWISGGAKAKSRLQTSFRYDRRCPQASAGVEFSLDDAANRFVNANVEKRGFAHTWIAYGDGGLFAGPLQHKKMTYQAMDGALIFDLDRAGATSRAQLALCPGEVGADKIAKTCEIFSLRGFARAFDFVCAAK